MNIGKKEFSGRIIIDDFDILFTITDFEVTFLSPNFSGIYDNKGICIRPEENGFVFGETYDGNCIAIYIGEEIVLETVVKIETWIYILFNGVDIVSSKKEFYGIGFCGGTINTLFPSSPLIRDFNCDDNKIVLNKNLNDCLHFAMNTEHIKGNMSLFSQIVENYSFSKGTEIHNGDAHLELIFNDFIELKDFERIYSSIISLCQFMAFRENVGFDMVYLVGKDENINATCYINEGENRTNKDAVRCITFKDLGESIVNLLESILKDTPDEPSYCVNFLPQNDMDVMFIDNTKLKNICSAIECEMNLAGINAASDENFAELIKDIKEIVKKHRDGEKPLENKKTYDFIFGDINHWNPALSDRIYETYLLYEKEIDSFLINFNHQITKEKIQEFANYRNTITHGSYKVADDNIFYTSVAIGALVYCCILKRIGVSESKIKELMERGILLYPV